MAQATDTVIRHRRRRASRWMQAAQRSARISAALRVLAAALPGFLLANAEIMGIPSGLHFAYLAARAQRGEADRPALAGALCAMTLRLLWGLDPHWETLLPLCAMYFSPQFLKGGKTPALLLWTAVPLLPVLLRAVAGGVPALMILSGACVAVAALSAPVLLRAMAALAHGRPMDSIEERLSCGYLGAMLLCGGARMLLAGMNVGVLGAGVTALLCGMCLTMGAGCIAGLTGGLMLALQGLPLPLCTALAAGGFLAGMGRLLGRRVAPCLCFGAGCFIVLLLSGCTGAGSGLSVLAATALVLLTPRALLEKAQLFLRRFLSVPLSAADAYASSALTAWEKTVAAMAQAVPLPAREESSADPEWWQAHLCAGCPELERCGCMLSDAARQQAELVWGSRASADEVWEDALEHLRGLGCARLYHLRQSMTALRQEDQQARRDRLRICAQRDMLVTHLTAMSGAARRFALLSAGDSWWDDLSARRLRRALSELALPAGVTYVRRVQGHARAAFSLHTQTASGKLAQELCLLATRVLEAPMALIRCEEDRAEVAEVPLLQAEEGMALCSYGDAEPSGDTAWMGRLQDGRFLAAISDGMGHGEQAARESHQTTELLRLCLDAGYTRRQTLTAVNGMMLMAGQGERFSTVDMLLIDLWTGQATLDKLGAAASWIAQQDGLTCLTGDALPLGILEKVDSQARVLHLRAGDDVVLLSDGVEDAFPTRSALEDAVRSALCQPTAQGAADALLAAARLQADVPQDDQSVVVVRLSQTPQRL